jgi:hypothetical protein
MWKSFVNVLVMGSLLWGAANVAAAAEPDGQSASSAMEWQILPGESLNSLAALFYPKDRRMQQRFVAATVALNRDRLQGMAPGKTFEESTTLQIPTLYALSRQAGKAHKRPAAVRKTKAVVPVDTPTQDSPKAAAPASKEQTEAYQALEKRAEQRQKELEKLNQRLKSLEESTKAVQDSLKANSQPIEEAQGRRLKRVE